MSGLAWLEVTDDDQILFVPTLGDSGVDAENLAPRGGIAYAEQWVEDQGWELLGDWQTARRLDGSWETRVLIGSF